MLRYLRGTTNLGLKYQKSENQTIGFIDADWASDKTDRKSTTGYFFNVYGNIILWASSKQTIVALSSTEAEYVATTSAVKEALWLIKMMNDMKLPVTDPTLIHEDKTFSSRRVES